MVKDPKLQKNHKIVILPTITLPKCQYDAVLHYITIL